MLQLRDACSWRRSVSVTACRVLSVLILSGVSTQAIAEVVWKNPGAQALPKMSPIGAAQAIRALAAPGRTKHVLVSFSEPVVPEVRETMRAAGVQLLAYVGDNTFFAAINEPQLQDGRLAAVASLNSAAAIDRSVKLHPMLLAGTVPQWAVVGYVTGDTGAPEPVVGAYMLFHGDVDLLTASILTMTSPRALSIARFKATGLIRSGLSTKRTRESRSATAATLSRVPSVLRPSATRISRR